MYCTATNSNSCVLIILTHRVACKLSVCLQPEIEENEAGRAECEVHMGEHANSAARAETGAREWPRKWTEKGCQASPSDLQHQAEGVVELGDPSLTCV